jgi:hypothetical protein
VRAIEAAVDRHRVAPVGRATGSHDRTFDFASELLERSAQSVEPEAGYDAERARSDRDSCSPLEEFAPVDRPTLALETAG